MAVPVQQCIRSPASENFLPLTLVVVAREWLCIGVLCARLSVYAYDVHTQTHALHTPYKHDGDAAVVGIHAQTSCSAATHTHMRMHTHSKSQPIDQPLA